MQAYASPLRDRRDRSRSILSGTSLPASRPGQEHGELQASDEITSEEHLPRRFATSAWRSARRVESANRSTAVTPAPAGDLPTYVPRGPQPVLMRAALNRVRLSTGGAIRLTVGERTLNFTSRTSEPGGPVGDDGQGSLATDSAGYERKGGMVVPRIPRDPHRGGARMITST